MNPTVSLLLSFTKRIFSLFPWWVWVIALYLATHLYGLLLLPVFADEAIYIRWAQLVIDDAQRFAFFSMSDGKPPLFVWTLSIFLPLFQNPLLAARFVSALCGLATVFILGAISKQLTRNKYALAFTYLFVMLAPFWMFYHRMAVMDAMLTMWIALSFYLALHISLATYHARRTPYQLVPHVLLFGLSFGAALLTKTPALFAIPIMAVAPLLALVVDEIKEQKTRSKKKIITAFVLTGIGGVFGSICFLLLRVSPFFGALFSRSKDFTFTVSEVIGGEWRYVFLESLPRDIGWLITYLTIAVAGGALLGLLYKRQQRKILLLLLCAALYALPLIVFGRMLWPRYFLPVSIFITLAAGISLGEIAASVKTRMIAIGIILVFLFMSARFYIPALTDVTKIPFVPTDRLQYLTEWSAGYGNEEVRQFLIMRRMISSTLNGPKMLVLTEGSFGTLPDGLLMYFHGKNQIPNLEIQGIGVSPSTIPAKYLERVGTEEVYYVVNSHRFGLVDQDNLEKILQIPRPFNGPSLVLFRVRAK